MHGPARLLAALLAWLIAMADTPALADVHASYSDLSDGRRRVVTIEVSDSGAARITDWNGYTLLVGKGIWQVLPGPGGPLAYGTDSIEDLQARRGGTSSDLSSEYGFAAQGSTEVAGFAGTVYQIGDITKSRVVLSDDPKLAPLGTAFSRFLMGQTVLNSVADEETDSILKQLARLMQNKGLLEFWELRLESLDFRPIDAARFTVPANRTTLSEEQSTSEAHTAPKPGEMIVEARFFKGQLLTRQVDGSLSSWTQASALGAPVAVPGSVETFCTTRDEVWLLTENESHTISIWSGSPGNWKKVHTQRFAKNDGYVAMDCSGAEPLLLTAKNIRLLRGGLEVPIKPGRTIAQRGFAVTLQLGGYLYVGINAGEWGGGLRRFPLNGGDGEMIEAADPEELCGGALNTACAPVTGLAADPANPDCLLASTGLVHMMQHGSIVRVCGKQISVAYAKPYTLEPGWSFDPKAASQHFGQSVPFYSIGSGRDGVWAVGSDGVYRFGTDPVPSFTPFARDATAVTGPIDWSNPGFVLISTNMNQRHSLSGESLILVPRPQN